MKQFLGGENITLMNIRKSFARPCKILREFIKMLLYCRRSLRYLPPYKLILALVIEILQGGILSNMIMLCKHNSTIIDLSAKGLLTVLAPDNTLWIIRTNNLSDTPLGPLLPYLHEPREYQLFTSIIERGEDLVFIDAGAYIGGYAIRACKNNSKIIAIEPDPDNYRILMENIKLNKCKDATVLNVAIGDKDSYVIIYLQSKEDYGTISLVGGNIPKSVIRVQRLDEIVRANSHEKFFVKIDVEGYEIEALKGMEKLFPAVKYVMVECGIKRCKQVLTLMRSNGFKVLDIICHEVQNLEHIRGGSFSCNIFFTH
jgi:FkbM family methyltransferase